MLVGSEFPVRMTRRHHGALALVQMSPVYVPAADEADQSGVIGGTFIPLEAWRNALHQTREIPMPAVKAGAVTFQPVTRKSRYRIVQTALFDACSQRRKFPAREHWACSCDP